MKAKNVCFICLDAEESSKGTVIPIEKLDILLAYEMNGDDIPPEHGYPVRVVATGLPGKKNVKWLGKIIIFENETNE